MRYNPNRINILLLILALGLNIYVRFGPANLAACQNVPRGSLKQGCQAYWQDEFGETFLLEADSFHWLRLVRDFVFKGGIGDTRKGDRLYDSLMLAPQGMQVEAPLHKNLHVYIAGLAFEVTRFFNKDIALTKVATYIPVAVITVALAVLFFLGRAFCGGPINIAGIMAVICLGLSPAVMERSVAGWFDTDGYVIIFSLLAAGMFYLSLLQQAALKKRIFYALLSSLAVGLFAFTWDGWWYIYYLVVISALYHLGNLVLLRRQGVPGINIKPYFFSLGIFVFFSLTGVAIFAGWEALGQGLARPWAISSAKVAWRNQIWPNAFITIGELRDVGFREIIKYMGGVHIIALSSLGLIAMYRNKNAKNYPYSQFLTLVCVFWLLLMLSVSVKAMRFVLLLGIPVSLLAGAAWDFLARRNKKIFAAGAAVFTALALTRALPAGNSVPLMNKNLYALLQQVKEKTPPRSIINAWWDYGHGIKAIAKRRVIFDGATQNNALPYWMGRFFSTENEEEAAAILRMLNNGGNSAFEMLDSNFRDPLRSVLLLKRLLANDPQAEEELFQNLPVAQARDVLALLRRAPAPAFVLVDSSMVPIISSISWLGNWDFLRVSIAADLKCDKGGRAERLSQETGVPLPKIRELCRQVQGLKEDEIAPWISPAFRIYAELFSGKIQQGMILFPQRLLVDMPNRRAYVYSSEQQKYIVPLSLIIFREGEFEEVTYPDSEVKVSVLLFDADSPLPRALLLDKAVAKSMFVRLCYLQGRGLKYFKPFLEREDKANGDYLRLFAIDWGKP